MHISWLGLSAFKLETKDAVIITDPFSPSVASRPVRAKADIVTVSAPDDPARNHVAGLSGDPFVIRSPGEYEVRGVYIRGIPFSNTTVFLLKVEELCLAHFGGAKQIPGNDFLEKLNGVDVLFLPVGGGPVFDPDDAMKVVNAIEPSVVVPMHVQQEGLKLKEKLLPVSGFLREIGASKVEPVERANVKKRDLNEEETTVLLLKA